MLNRFKHAPPSFQINGTCQEPILMWSKSAPSTGQFRGPPGARGQAACLRWMTDLFGPHKHIHTIQLLTKSVHTHTHTHRCPGDDQGEAWDACAQCHTVSRHLGNLSSLAPDNSTESLQKPYNQRTNALQTLTAKHQSRDSRRAAEQVRGGPGLLGGGRGCAQEKCHVHWLQSEGCGLRGASSRGLEFLEIFSGAPTEALIQMPQFQSSTENLFVRKFIYIFPRRNIMHLGWYVDQLIKRVHKLRVIMRRKKKTEKHWSCLRVELQGKPKKSHLTSSHLNSRGTSSWFRPSSLLGGISKTVTS